VAINEEDFRKLLGGPANNTGAALKEWRRLEGLSQMEAALRLGVSVRTLQGWELGRPMSHPELLRRAVNNSFRPKDEYALVQSDFPREFAEFINFVGATNLDKAVRKVERKLEALSPSNRTLFGNRYFLHEQCVRFTEGSPAFQLDVTNRVAVRAASLISGINRVRRSLSPKAISRFQAMVLDNLKPDRDVRQIEHEIRCSVHLSRKGFDVKFADLEGLGNFDLLAVKSSEHLQIECKTVTEDTGSQIKSEMTANLSEIFRETIVKGIDVGSSGLFILTFHKPTRECKNVGQKLRDALQSASSEPLKTDDFSIEFVARPEWREPSSADELLKLQQQIASDPALGNFPRCAIRNKQKILGLVLRPHKPSVLTDRIVDVIKDGADQCPREKKSQVWLHFVGLAETQFLAVAELSMEGKGAGLNAIVANALHPAASTTDRTHVQNVLFSADGDNLNRHPVLGPNLIISRAVSSDGAIYDVPNPYCRFTKSVDT
jgi:transcriptional regulator with XRE-family HTH domain